MVPKTDGYRIRIRKAGANVHEAPFDGETLILGSGGGAGIRLEDPRISNLHVLLKREAGTITAIDLGSEHGTRLGEDPIHRPVALGAGDILRMGSYEVEVLHPERQLPRPPPPGGGRVARNTLAVRPMVAPSPPPTPEARSSSELTLDARLWSLIDGPLPADRRPTANDFVLQVSLVWGDRLISVLHCPKGVDATLGGAPNARVRLFSPLVPELFCLGHWRGDGVELAIPPGGRFELRRDGEILGADRLRSEGRLSVGGASTPERVGLALGERARIELGPFGLLVRHVRATQAVKGLALRKRDLLFRGMAGLLVMIGMGLLVAVALQPPPPMTAGRRLSESAKAYAHYFVRPKPKAVHHAGEKAKDEEGKSGEHDPEKEKTPDVSKRTATRRRERNSQRPLHAGLLGAIPSNSKLFGSGGLGTGIDRALSGLKGSAPVANAHGFGGLAPRAGKGGANASGLGIGGLGTHGMGRGGGGFGTVDLGGKGRAVTRIIPGRTTVVGGLSRDVIERVIRRHESEIKYCYEIQLGAHPDLAGKVGVAFTIDAKGLVSKADVSESTLQSSATERCMLQKIRRWRFPKPLGGGVVAVEFPWIFKPAGH